MEQVLHGSATTTHAIPTGRVTDIFVPSKCAQSPTCATPDAARPTFTKIRTNVMFDSVCVLTNSQGRLLGQVLHCHMGKRL